MDFTSQLNDALVLVKPFMPMWALASIGLLSYGLTYSPDKPQHDASATTKKRGSVFGAAEQNIVLTPEEAAGDNKSEASTASDARYAFVKYLTTALDYAEMIGLLYYLNEHYAGEKFNPRAAFMIFITTQTSVVCMDIFKGIIFSDVVPKAKTDHLKHLGKEFIGLFSPSGLVSIAKFFMKLLTGEGIIRNFKDKGEQRRGILYHLYYNIKSGFITAPALMYMVAYCGFFTLQPAFETAYEIPLGDFTIPVPNFVNNYVIYLFMSFIKDTICMNILHQMMHRHWYDKHYVHHLPMKEVSNINYTFFDIEDMMLENSVAPALILLLKFCMDPTKTPIIDMFSYILLLHNDANSHSICPYTVGFFFPPLDAILSPTVSHTLHHALNMGHYTIWPLHQLKGIFQYDNRSKTNVDGSLAKDWATYNRVFKTDFPEGRGVKVE